MDSPNSPPPAEPYPPDEVDRLVAEAAQRVVGASSDLPPQADQPAEEPARDPFAIEFSHAASGPTDHSVIKPIELPLPEVAKHEIATRDAIINELSTKGLVDARTGVLNDEGLENAFASLIHNVAPEGRRSDDTSQRHAILAVDADEFREINRIFGHPGGNVILRQIADTMRSNTRSNDIIGRTGGDEFIIILPRTDMKTATLIADRVRLGMHELPLQTPVKPEYEAKRPTVSIGVAEVDPTKDLTGNKKPVDMALYDAKDQGRDKTVQVGPNPEEQQLTA